MSGKFSPFIATLTVLFAASILLFSGCSKDGEDDGAMKDGSSWGLVNTYSMQIPGAVWPISSGVVVVGANNEHVYRSTNAGRSWSTIVLDESTGRKALDMFATPSRLIMVGERGMIYTSTDDGVTWVDASVPSVVDEDKDLVKIVYPGTGEFNPLFIVGYKGALLKSTNEGASWTEVDLGIVDAESTMIIDDDDTTWDHTPVYVNQDIINFTTGYAPNPSWIYAVGDTLVIDSELYFYYSKNGGVDWDILTIPRSGAYHACYFSDDTTGLLFGPDGAVWKVWTTDDAVRMSSAAILGSGRHFQEIKFVTPDLGWAVGAGGTVAKTVNAGNNWSLINVDVTGTIYDISWLNANEGWIVGDDMSRGTAAIKHTTDGGENWFFRSYGLGLSLSAVHFISSSEGWIAGSGGRIAKTEDGGRVWIHQDSYTERTIQDIFFLDENRGWAVGFSTNQLLDTLMTILYTIDGGGEWASLEGLSGQRLNRVKFADANNGWTVGNGGLILHSDDGGQTWAEQNSGTLAELFDIDVLSAQTAFAVGQYGTILKTTDGGGNWTELSSGTEQGLTGIDMVNSSTGYVCGSLGTILKTTNGGNSWEKLELPPYSGTVLKSIAFVNSEVGWAVGKFGYILHTVDGGETWYRQQAGFTEAALNDIFILNANRAWIVGDASILLELHP
ncbi:MAG TPA: hypothetical protein ENN07_03610 [candidate division Zixibacteria bacterium]|nr:hypothetical protein [candidate division Zixibacteria bacterium]